MCRSNSYRYLTKGKAATNVTAKLNYTGGNGKVYANQIVNSTGFVGLTARLNAGSLTTGNGSLMYLIEGTPTTSGTVSFAITLGGKSCIIKINVDNIAQNPTSGYGPNVTGVEGNSYKTVYIGTQQWMGENLKVSKYSDGTTIPNITDNSQWQNNTTGAWYRYLYDYGGDAGRGNYRKDYGLSVRCLRD